MAADMHDDDTSIRPIAHIHTDLPQKFGVPRQAGLVPELQATIEFEPEFALPEAVRGLEGFSHLWLIWKFEGTERKEGWSPTVRPPRLGGNTRMGVFATRSPFRPNPLGLSSVRLESVEVLHGRPVLRVSGADLRDNTPIFDIKPYLPYTDSHESATSGFAAEGSAPDFEQPLNVDAPEPLLSLVPEEKRPALLAVLAQDPRPAFQHDASRIYRLAFTGFDISFTVDDETRALFVTDIAPASCS